MDLDEQTTSVFGPLAVRILGWAGAALAGAMLTLLLNSSGDHRQVQMDADRISKIEAQVTSMQTVYATNKRVDDLQTEVRSNYHDLSSKLDNVLKILIERK